MTIEMLKGKIHRATVIQAELDYVGSITVDEELLEAAGILEKDFRKAFKKGYTPKELSMILKNAGIIIPAYLMEKFLKTEDEASPPITKQQKQIQEMMRIPYPPLP